MKNYSRDYGKIMENCSRENGRMMENQRIWEDDGKLDKRENDGELAKMAR